jgi:hypothetical protein
MNNTVQEGVSAHPIADRLQRAGITKAIIVDDAYDVPTRDTCGGSVADFWAKIEQDQSLLAEVRELKPGLNDEAGIDDMLLAQLWERRDILHRLGPLLKKELFIAKLGDLNTLKCLTDHLSQLGVESLTVGKEGVLPEDQVKLVFIDYYLGSEITEKSVETSVAIVKKLYRRPADGADRPFFVLMSSKPDVEGVKDTFREKSDLVSGLFGYIPKDDLENKERLYIHLAAWAFDMPARHEIQHFVEALESAAEKARTGFVQKVRALGFEDYANIQWLSLQAEGHPLGSYMLWLYKSLFAYLLHANEGVLAQQKKLDVMSFKQFTPYQATPSPHLAETYLCALTEPGIEDVGPHPRAGDERQEPFLQFGDLFFKEECLEVLMVINAACDLTYAPGANREFPSDLAVLLLHGTLQPCDGVASGTFRTELFMHEDKAYRIAWNHRHVTSKQYSEVKAWFDQQRYVRKARLALPYALQVQQEFGMKLMRIGMPIKPPLFYHADVEVYRKGEDGKGVLVGESIGHGAIIFSGRINDSQDKTLFVLTKDCVQEIVKRLDTVIEDCRRIMPPENEKEKAGSAKRPDERIEKLKVLKNLEWVEILRTPISLPKVNAKKAVRDQLCVYYDRNIDGQYTEQSPIVLNVRLAPPVEETSEEGGLPAVSAQEEATRLEVEVQTAPSAMPDQLGSGDPPPSQEEPHD